MSFVNTAFTRTSATTSTAYARVQQWARPIAAVCAGIVAAALAGIVADTVVITLVGWAALLTGSFFFSYLIWLLGTFAGFGAVILAGVAATKFVLDASTDALSDKVRNSFASARTWVFR